MSNLQSLVSNNFNQNPISGVFGNGNVRFFSSSTTWTVPAGITRVRARVWGAGGSSAGGGGGFAMETISSGLGATVAITVGTGTCSFGAFVSATAGATGAAGGAGGVGSGGDINNTGGISGGLNAVAGGGGVASLLGDGGAGGGSNESGKNGASGGGGGVTTTQGSTCIGGNGFTGRGGVVAQQTAAAVFSGYLENGYGFISPFSIDFIGTGGGGCGRTFTGFQGSAGSNGGGSGQRTFGGHPGGGGGGDSGTGASGLVIVEW
jgi:hypothetical protein